MTTPHTPSAESEGPAAARARLPRYGVVVISVPKCGTMLLRNLLLQLPGTRVGRNLLRYVEPGLPPEERPALYARALAEVPPGGVSVGHCMFDEQTRSTLARYPNQRVFILRDPRDFIVSYIDYVMDPASKHFHHELFTRRLPDDAARIETMIRGVPGDEHTFPLPPVREYFENFLGWLVDPATEVVRFEELMEARLRLLAMERLGRCLGLAALPRPRLQRLIEHGLDPTRSRTFRVGRSGRWRERFTAKLTALYEIETGDLDARLGYIER